MAVRSVAIGPITVPNPVFLAPMAGFTDRSFRLLCREHGCGLTISEMVSVKSLIYGNANTKPLLEADDADTPRAVQLFGRDPQDFTEAIRRLEELPFEIIDINMGCPVPKIVRNGEGSALMNDPALAGRIIEAAVRASVRPVTVKIRKGFSPARVNAVEMARVAQESGASAIAVHGRTRDQFYAGCADWTIISDVKQAVRIPVVGNGDVFTPEDGARMFADTGCDAIMMGRGAMGNPWLFSQMLSYLETGKAAPAPDWNTKVETALRHVRMVAGHKGERAGIPEMRKTLSWYVKASPQASELRRQINTAATYEALAEILAVDK